MISYCNNEFLQNNTKMNTECQMLFFQKMKELLHMHSGISYSFRIHNSYTILKELMDTIMDYEKGKINGMIVEEIRKEAKVLLADDLVIKSKYPELYETIKEEIGTGLTINKNSQSIDDRSVPQMNMMKESIKQLFRTFTPVDYFKNSIILTKAAVDDNDGKRVVRLCPIIVSSSIMVGRSTSGMYKAIDVLFQNQECQFDDNWRRWSVSMLNTESIYQCFIPIDETYSDLVTNRQRGAEIKIQYSGAKNLDYIDEENNLHLDISLMYGRDGINGKEDNARSTVSCSLEIIY